MKPFGENESIVSLYNRLKLNCKNITHIELATSYLLEDEPLAQLFKDKNLPTYQGHPESVIDRLLEVAIKINRLPYLELLATIHLLILF